MSETNEEAGAVDFGALTPENADEVVLVYALPGATFTGVPACDLTHRMIHETGLSMTAILALHVGHKHLYERAIKEPSNG